MNCGRLFSELNSDKSSKFGLWILFYDAIASLKCIGTYECYKYESLYRYNAVVKV